jgi:quercetin dioxygenase-like cupin family protein
MLNVRDLEGIRPLRVVAFLLLLAALSGCGWASRAVKRPTHAYPEAENLARWLDEHPLAPDQEIGVAEMGRTENSSMHIVQIRHQEALHVHQHHDLAALLHLGHGTLRLGSQALTLKAGSVVMIPRGVPHAFKNESRQPAAAFVVFTPPFDGADTVPINE